MNTRRNLLILAAIVIVLIALALLARQYLNPATLVDGKNVIFTDEYRLDESLDGDLVVVARVIALESSATVNGNVSLIGSEIIIDGHIDGQLTVLGEQIRLNESSVVDGDVNLMGADALVAGTIDGDILVNADTAAFTSQTQEFGTITACVDEITIPDAVSVAPCPEDDVIKPFEPLLALRDGSTLGLSVSLSPLGLTLSISLSAITLVGLATIAVTAFPRQISHIEDAVRTRPTRFLGVGIALYALGVGITLALITLLALVPPLGLLLLPVYLIALVLLLALMLCGLITLALVIGDVIMQRIAKNRLPPLVAAVVGSAVLSVGLTLLVVLPFGWLADVLIIGAVSAVGLGASMVTRLGTRPVTPTYFVQG